MSGLPSATYLDTRLSIMAAQLLPDDALQGLISQPLEKGLAEHIDLGLDDIATDQLHIEHALARQLLDDFAIVMRPLSGPARDFLSFWARRFELFNLKALIRGKLRGLPAADIESQFQETPGFSLLPHDRLLRTESVAELLRLIEAGPYGGIARQARQALEQKQDSVAVEAVIDQRYYLGLAQRAQHLPEPDRRPMTRLLGAQLDRLNLGWMLRYRFAYGLSPTETYYYLILHGRVVDRQHLLQLVEMDDLAAVLAALPEPLASRLQDATDTFGIEHRLQSWVLEQAWDALRQRQSTVTRAFAYLLLRDKQLRRLRAVLQGKRLGLDTELIERAAGLGAH